MRRFGQSYIDVPERLPNAGCALQIRLLGLHPHERLLPTMPRRANQL